MRLARDVRLLRQEVKLNFVRQHHQLLKPVSLSDTSHVWLTDHKMTTMAHLQHSLPTAHDLF